MSFRTPWHYLPLETRAFPEFAWGWLRQNRVNVAPATQPKTIIVVPGFGANAAMTQPLREVLSRAGHRVLDWGQGRNLGMTKAVGSGLQELLLREAQSSPQGVCLIGWSLGGVFVRELARRQPQAVQQVITLGSPIQDADHTTVDMLFRKVNKIPAGTTPEPERKKRAAPPPVPCAAIYTLSDGVVPWQASLEQSAENTKNYKVRGSHMGLPANPAVWHICLNILQA